MSTEIKSLSSSYLFGYNAPYVEELYRMYLKNPSLVSESWRQCFHRIQITGNTKNFTDGQDSKSTTNFSRQHAQENKKTSTLNPDVCKDFAKHLSVLSLISAYHSLGSRSANLDPLHRQNQPKIPELDIGFHKLTQTDLEYVFPNTSLYFTGVESMTLGKVLEALKNTYCSAVGTEFIHLSDTCSRNWIQERLESTCGTYIYTPEKKRQILQQLTESEGLEQFLHSKYVGQKRFSLEGGESFIVAMNELVSYSGEKGIEEIVIGMAHRGRLNLLINTMGKIPADLFSEFEGKFPKALVSGDVKYHNGFSSSLSTSGGPVHLSLAFNPSHLEIIGPVVEGNVRARQDSYNDHKGKKVLPVLVHGDAAFSGQGVVMETLNLGKTRGYGTGGTIHIVINNQVGFTTSDLRDARSTFHCTDIAKMIEAPVFHVNGDDPEAVLFVTRLALDYRLQFSRDVIVDIVCFRKLGHNEQDTPSVTQPLMYKHIKDHPGTRKVYANKLVKQNILSEEEIKQTLKDFRVFLEDGQSTRRPVLKNHRSRDNAGWNLPNPGLTSKDSLRVSLDGLKRTAERICIVPEDFSLHPLVAKVINDRRAMARDKINLDWGMAEHLAFATLLQSGYAVRISGQDSGRGTFTHRHAVLHDQKRSTSHNGVYTPLQNISENQANFTVIDSILSEEAVMAFEYGYSTCAPRTLTIWEGQFGDFANGAQVVIDQFISSGEAKWGRCSGLTLMLPHGYEGQGSEHSSARIERFLQLSADTNMQLVQPTTASQIFHLLRHQMIRSIRKPLIIFTPKSLLRNKSASSPLVELAEGEFQTLIGEVNYDIHKEIVKRILVCSGKVYYDLIRARSEREVNHTAIIRIEQLYPFPDEAFRKEILKYTNLEEVIWVQDEPENQGPWISIKNDLYRNIAVGQKLGYAGRLASASPAAGYLTKHIEQLQELINRAYEEDYKGFTLIK